MIVFVEIFVFLIYIYFQILTELEEWLV